MMHSGLGSNTIHSLSQAWSSESRGARLTSSDFETKTKIRTGPNPVEAILVLPVAVHVAKQSEAGAERVIAEYPLYAAIAVDRQKLEMLDARGQAGNRYTTLSEATGVAAALNRDSENAYLNDYQSGQLSGIRSWQKTLCDNGLDGGISLTPAANQSLNF